MRVKFEFNYTLYITYYLKFITKLKTNTLGMFGWKRMSF